jgi:predicted secreted protein
MLQVDESRNGAEFDLAPGEEIEVTLSENPTTGYRWHLQPATEGGLAPDEDAYEPFGAAPGAMGRRRWRFRAPQEGVVRLQWDHRRSWERAATKSFTITIRVKTSTE